MVRGRINVVKARVCRLAKVSSMSASPMKVLHIMDDASVGNVA
jgi:hypothetical protein